MGKLLVLNLLVAYAFGRIEPVKQVSLLSKIQKNAPAWKPSAVVDIGANRGDWSRGLRALWPTAKIMMFEASPQHNDSLASAAKEIGNADYRIAVLNNQESTVEFYQGGDTGNSMFRENTKLFANDRPITRPSRTLDQEVADSFLRDEVIDIVKADVQGAELVVFQGAIDTLKQATFVQFEASTVEFNAGAPCTHEVDAFLRSQGFVLHDMAAFNYNVPGFHTYGVGQYDALYVKPDSPRFPQAFRALGGRYCGQGRSFQPLEEPTPRQLFIPDNIPGVDVIAVWLSGFCAGAVLMAATSRLFSRRRWTKMS